MRILQETCLELLSALGMNKCLASLDAKPVLASPSTIYRRSLNPSGTRLVAFWQLVVLGRKHSIEVSVSRRFLRPRKISCLRRQMILIDSARCIELAKACQGLQIWRCSRSTSLSLILQRGPYPPTELLFCKPRNCAPLVTGSAVSDLGRDPVLT